MSTRKRVHAHVVPFDAYIRLWNTKQQFATIDQCGSGIDGLCNEQSIPQRSTSAMSTHLQGHFFSAQGGDDPPLFGPVNLYVKHGKYRFSREDGMLIETAVDAWERQSIFRKSVSQNVWLYRIRTTGMRYFTETLPKKLIT
ncbi:uncharacterized protein RAG0_07639 [Rhynchosporium agropyri]|uniref:Uncharacterized protein n=1 Tax=Rhynchosporium agropyri TaxID=914238 RepID=A0A1E1KMD3_9HELO|nr:uncharacterized protein RAG0_07639 [Rhynchosporium agropyri]